MSDFKNLSSIFLRVPDSISNFDGASVSTTIEKLLFDEKNHVIWAKGKSYGFSKSESDLSESSAMLEYVFVTFPFSFFSCIVIVNIKSTKSSNFP